MPFKLTKLEKSWVLYDVGNSAFMLLVSTIIPIYFKYLAELEGISSIRYLAYWGYAASIATLLGAVIGLICGALADIKGFKKPIFMMMLSVGIVGCLLMGYVNSWLAFLVIFIAAKVCYSSCNIFYDAMLTDVTTKERMDQVSSLGFAWGYIGSCIPFCISLGLLFGKDQLGLTMRQIMLLILGLIALWWLSVTLPLIKNYKQKHYIAPERKFVLKSFKRLGEAFKAIGEDRKLFLFILAFFFYIDGVYTIIEMAIAYGQALGLNSMGLLLALLVTQIVAFPCSLYMAYLAKRYATTSLITVCILAYIFIALFGFFMTSQFEFWLLAIFVGIFQGGLQALSRAHFAKIIPPEKSGEYFGILDICGKGASFMGTLLMGIMSQLTRSVNAGVGILSIIFMIGLVLFRKSVACDKEEILMEQVK